MINSTGLMFRSLERRIDEAIEDYAIGGRPSEQIRRVLELDPKIRRCYEALSLRLRDVLPNDAPLPAVPSVVQQPSVVISDALCFNVRIGTLPRSGKERTRTA